MLHKLLPLCISVSQAGKTLPLELWPQGTPAAQAALLPEFLAWEAMVDWEHPVQHRVLATLPATILNLDVPPDDAIPDFLPNGAPVYPGNARDRKNFRKQLLKDYYQAYYSQLQAAAHSSIQAGVDFHVASFDPLPQPSGLPLAPKLCLSNNGNYLGEAQGRNRALTCDPDLLRDARDILTARLADRPGGPVLLNTRIAGGQIIRTLGQKKIPWIRLAVSRDLLLDAEGKVSTTRVADLRDRLQASLVMLCKVYDWI